MEHDCIHPLDVYVGYSMVVNPYVKPLQMF